MLEPKRPRGRILSDLGITVLAILISFAVAYLVIADAIGH